MYSKLTLTQKYIHYYFTASNGKGHGVHSPFVFDFVTNVLNDRREFYSYQQIENIRKQLLSNGTVIEIEDFGAGSALSKNKQRKISDIAKDAAKKKKLAQLLFRIVNYYQPERVIELGTSLGISTAYLASANSNSKLVTIEGSAALAKMARRNFELLDLANIQLITGTFDQVLPEVLKIDNPIDLAFIDGNHRKLPTIKYFDQLTEHSSPLSIFIFDDIHWSKEMEEAWKIIKASEKVTLTIDLFFLGLVFFRKDFKVKQDFVVRF